jgi:hypothetical protein
MNPPEIQASENPALAGERWRVRFFIANRSAAGG